MNEAETRAGHIDPALKAAGWGVIDGSRIRREYFITPGRIEGHGRRGKPLKADCVFEYRKIKLADPTQTSTRYRNYVPFWA
jgi:type I restriction enzyme R subunit